MSEFKEGDRVKFLDEPGSGTFIRLKNNRLAIIEVEGMEVPHDVKFLILANEDPHHEIHVESHEENEVLSIPSSAEWRRNEKGDLEIDLHFHEVYDQDDGIEHGEKLQIQLEYFRTKLEEARKKGEQRIVVIHGVGKGVLKHAVRDILQHMESVRYHEASYRYYGHGATMVEFK